MCSRAVLARRCAPGAWGRNAPRRALTFGIADTFVQHGDRDLLLKYLGLQPKQMARRIRAALEEKKNG